MLTAALLLGAAPGANAAYTLAQLQVIERLMLAGDLTSLRLFLEQNPEILEGDDALAIELREFLQEQQSALSDFGFLNDDDDDDNTTLLLPDPY